VILQTETLNSGILLRGSRVRWVSRSCTANASPVIRNSAEALVERAGRGREADVYASPDSERVSLFAFGPSLSGFASRTALTGAVTVPNHGSTRIVAIMPLSSWNRTWQ
jgi:hypothetical protein